MVGLPTTIGKGLQFAGNELGMPGVADTGAGMVQSADVRGEAPGLTLQPEGHSGVLNSIARVTAGSGAFLPGVAAALIPGLQGLSPALFAAGGIGAAAESGENTREAVAAVKGNTASQANTAGLIDAGQAAVLNLAGGKLFGGLMEATANPMIKAARGMIGQDAPALAGSIMSDLTGVGGAIMPVLKQLPMTALETTGIIGGQNAASAGIQQAYGVQGGPTPWEAFKGSLGDSLTTAGLFSGIAMRGRAVRNNDAQARTAILAHPDTDPAVRSQMADQYAQALAKPGTPEAKAASTAFRENAQIAIENKIALPVNSDLFTAGTVAPPPGPTTPITAAKGQTGDLFGGPPTGPAAPPVEPSPGVDIAQPGQGDLFPLGRGENADLFGGRPAGPADLLGEAPVQPVGEAAPQAPTPQPGQREMFDQQTNLFKDTYEQSQTRAAAVDAIRNATTPGPDMSAQDFINKVTGVDNPGLTKQQAAKRQADAKAAINEPSGVRANDPDTGHERELTMGELFDRRAQAAQAQAASEAPRAPDETKALPEVTSDLQAVNKTITGSDKMLAQQSTPVLKELGKLGIDALPDHAAQISAVQGALDDPASKIGSATRERLRGLVDKWKAELPDTTAEARPDNVEASEPASALPPEQTIAADVQTAKATADAAPLADPSVAPWLQKDVQPGYEGSDGRRDDAGDTFLQSNNAFGKATGATRQAGGHNLRGRQNVTLGTAVRNGDLPGAIAALTKSKNVIVQRVAELARGLGIGHSIQVDNEARETQQAGRMTAAEQHEVAQHVVGQLDGSRMIKAALDAHPDGSREQRNAVRDAYNGLSDTEKAGVQNGQVNMFGGLRGTRAEFDAAHQQLEESIKANGNTEQRWRDVATNAPVERTAVSGSYEPATKTIATTDYHATDEHVVAHELTHALTHQAIDNPTARQRPVVARLTKLYEHVKDKLGEGKYGTTSLHEFVAEGMSNPAFQKNLHDIKYENTSVWSKFTQHVADLLGIQHGTAFTELLNLHEDLQGKNRAPKASDIHGENLPPPTPATVEQPAASVRAQESLPDNLPKTLPEQARDTFTRLKNVVKDMAERQLYSGLPDSEKQRFKTASSLRDTFAEIVGTKGGKHTESFIRDMMGHAETVMQPYPPGFDDRLNLQGSLDTSDAGIGAALDRSNKLTDVLGHISTNSTDPANRALAKRLADRLAVMGSEPTTQRDTGVPGEADVKAEYSRQDNMVTIHPGGESEYAVLHEAGHAAQAAAIDYVGAMDKPRNQAEAQLKQGYAEVDAVRQKALLSKDSAGQEYSLSNMHEFMTELNSNPDFQSFLRRQGTQKSWWARSVDAVRKLLGMKVDERTALEKSMALNDALFGADHEAADAFQRSMMGAAKAVDGTLQVRIKAVDDFMKSVDDKGLFTTMKHAVFREALGWQTQDYTASRLHAVPEMVRSGMASAADAYRAARDSVRQASEHLDKIFGDYANGVKNMYGAMGDAVKARAIDRQLGRIGTEASMGGFDFRMNFADNVKATRDLDPANKAYIDGIHREFTQLQRTHPDAAKALERGELVNRKMLITKFAPRLRNVLDARAGIATRLASDLQRMTPEVAQAAQDRVNTAAAKLAALPPEDASNRAQRAQLTAELATAQQLLPASRIAAAQSEVDLAAAHGPGLDFMRKDVRDAPNPNSKLYHDGGAALLGQRITDMFADARNLPAGTPLRDHMAEMEKEYLAQMKNPYFSAGRTGNYFVSMGFKNMDAATQAKLQAVLHGTNKELGNLLDPTNNRAFFRVDTQDQAEGLHARMLAAAGADHIADGTPAWGKLGDKSMISTHGVSPAISSMLGDIDTMVDHTPGLSPEQGQQMKATLHRSMMSLLPETSVRAAKMQRRGVPGYEAKFLDNFTNRAAGAVQDTANLYGSRAYTGAVKQMGDAVTKMNSSPEYSGDGRVRAQAVADEFNKRYANGMNSFDNSIVNTINSIGSTFYLMASPAYLIRTSAQPWHRGLPAMGSRYGFASSSAAIGKAQFDASKIFYKTLQGGYQEGKMRGLLNVTISAKDLGLSAGDQQFIMEMHDRGELNLGMTGQLQAASMRGSQLSQDAARLAGLTAQIAEMHGRASVGLAAFRLAEKGKPGIDQQGRMANIDYAQTLMRNAMDNFDSNNTARRIGKFGFAGPVTPLFTQFMNYNLQTMQQITRTVQDGFMNKDPSAAGLQRSAEAKKEFTGLMATTAMVSGALGLPFVNAFAGVYNMLTKDDDNPADIRIAARNGLAHLFGPQGGEFASHGVGGLINMDTSTFGLENLLPGSEFLADRRLLQDKLESQSQQLLGPALNGGLSVLTGLSKMSDGYYIKGLEAMLPSGLKAPYKAAELADHGYTDSKGNPIQVGDTKPGQLVGGWDIALQAAGFRTAEKASTDEFRNYAQTQEQLLQHRSQVITDHFYKATLPGHEAELPAVQQEMTDFDRANPTTPIRGTALADAIKTRVQTNALGGVNRKFFPSLGPQMDFLGRQPNGGGMPAGQ